MRRQCYDKTLKLVMLEMSYGTTNVDVTSLHGY